MAINKLLINWYNVNKRELPWRTTNNPYKIWISEIILQQTRVAQGIKYYLNFIEQFPDIITLAESDENEVLKAWEGLGYYSRARNLRESAKIIIKQYEGVFPESYSQILTLKGIGPYTAGAISSIAFNLPYPAIDGNVKRVISRIYGLKENIGTTTSYKNIEKIIYRIIDKDEPGKFNQALMDFGSLVCIPQNPLCPECVLKEVCYASTNNMVKDLPLTYKLTKQSNRAFQFFIFTEKDKIIISKRTDKDIWKGLYDFPSIESQKILSEKLLIEKLIEKFNLSSEEIIISGFSPLHKHKLSHQNIEARFIHVEIKGISAFSDKHHFTLSSIGDLESFPFPRLIQRYLEEHFYK